MPVGRVQYLHMLPMSFGECLTAMGKATLRTYLDQVTLREGIDTPLYDGVLSILLYAVGHMPPWLDEALAGLDGPAGR